MLFSPSRASTTITAPSYFSLNNSPSQFRRRVKRLHDGQALPHFQFQFRGGLIPRSSEILGESYNSLNSPGIGSPRPGTRRAIPSAMNSLRLFWASLSLITAVDTAFSLVMARRKSNARRGVGHGCPRRPRGHTRCGWAMHSMLPPLLQCVGCLLHDRSNQRSISLNLRGNCRDLSSKTVCALPIHSRGMLVNKRTYILRAPRAQS